MIWKGSEMFLFFTGRREFVQRLKLEATLNVHNGCVSAHSFLFLIFFFCVSSVSSCKHRTQLFLRKLCEASVSDRRADLWLRVRWFMPVRNLKLTQQSHVVSQYQSGRCSSKTQTATADTSQESCGLILTLNQKVWQECFNCVSWIY